MSHLLFCFFFVLSAYVVPIKAEEKAEIWNLEMDFQFSEKMEEKYKPSLVMTLCNPTDKVITFADSIHYGTPFYSVSYEIKGNEEVPTMVNVSFENTFSGMEEVPFISLPFFKMTMKAPLGVYKQMTHLKGGECKIYSESSGFKLGLYYSLKVREARGRNMYENHRNNVKGYLDQDDLDALFPKKFRVHVSIMNGTYDNPKTKGITFRSDWFSITDFWLIPSFENKPIIQE